MAFPARVHSLAGGGAAHPSALAWPFLENIPGKRVSEDTNHRLLSMIPSKPGGPPRPCLLLLTVGVEPESSHMDLGVLGMQFLLWPSF